ncbi:MAG: DUF4255 domain-containing protein [Kouleothrix sp.]|jgi:hypothetical protein|nr:DUF4255 domain-containing protein [Kouleothrix sp.]
MSNDQAIAAVTLTLRSLLDREFNAPLLLPPAPDLSGTRVSVRPPDRARDGFTGNQVNLFMFQTNTNAALRNTDLPLRIRADGRGFPPLALNLLYLVTAYGRDGQDPDLFAHRLLGRAMSVLHDTPLLTADQLRAATVAELPDSDLHEQIEHVRITAQPISLEDLSRLWAIFQTQYRISTVYHVAVVLIESQRRASAALPVLRRGAEDRGADVYGDVVPPYPTLDRLEGAPRRPNAQLGDTIELFGHHLDGSNPTVVFSNPRLEVVNEVAPLPGGTPTSLRVRLPKPPGDLPDPADDPDAAERWPAGFYAVTLRVERHSPGESTARARLSNALPLVLAPQVRLPANPLRRDGDKLFVSIGCVPQLRPGQHVALLIAGRELPAGRILAETDRREFEISGLAPGTYVVRLRVDGVDSMPIAARGASSRLEFADDQKVTIE